MAFNSLLKRALWALLLVLAASPAFAQFKVIGYLPSWTGEVSAVQFGKLTHINYAFLLPNANGTVQAIENPAKLQSLVSTAHANNVKVLISVGGWLDGNPGVFVSIGNNAGYTSAFTTNLINFLTQYNLDGVDIDWEHPDANSQNGYASVMQSLATALHSRGKLLTTAVAGGTWAGPYIQASVLSNVDLLNIMAYDDTAPAHSTYALASQSVSYWRGRGLPAAKTVLGVPFYGQPNGVPYATLLAQGASPTADLFNGVGYNGITTIKSKTNLAFDQGGGIMIWHLGQDAVGANSLLTAINQVVLARGGTTPPPATAQAVPGTIQAESFSAQSGTQTETTTDAGGGLNVGYIEAGDWLDYAVNVATAGSYTVGFRVASLSGGGQVQLRNAAGTSLGSVAIGATGGWQSWATLTTTVTLPAGAQTLRVYAVAGGFNLNYLTFATGSTPPPTNTPPTVSLTSPANGASAAAPASFTITATAADANGTVSSVAFYQGTTLLGTDTTSPYSYAWTGVAAGTYSLTAKATDNAGAVTTSSAVSVTVTSGSGGTPCSSAPAWVAATAYVAGNNVSYQGKLYTAKWWSQGEDPATHSCTDCSWRLVGPCTGARGTLASASSSAATQLSVYPNPIGEGQRLSVELGASYGKVQLVLTDLSGRTLTTAVYQNVRAVELSVPAGLAKGLLLLQINTGQETITRKISLD